LPTSVDQRPTFGDRQKRFPRDDYIFILVMLTLLSKATINTSKTEVTPGHLARRCTLSYSLKLRPNRGDSDIVTTDTLSELVNAVSNGAIANPYDVPFSYNTCTISDRQNPNEVATVSMVDQKHNIIADVKSQEVLRQHTRLLV